MFSSSHKARRHPRSQPRIMNSFRRNNYRASNGQCTHLTMTRLFTREFRCSCCLRTGSMGWVYRCTQDREILLDDDLERGIEEKFDAFPDLFERSTVPKKRSAAARLSRTSFLDELTDEQLATYTDEQVQLILYQRSQLLDILTPPERSPSPSLMDPIDAAASTIFDPPPTSNTLSVHSSSTSSTSKTPWLPLPNGECQFKCCHSCRPTLHDRSHLRLNAIVNGEIPSTTLLGFGFHLNRERPVIPVDLWRRIGLRENPQVHTHPSPTSSISPTSPATPLLLPPSPLSTLLPPTPTTSSSRPRRNTTASPHLQSSPSPSSSSSKDLIGLGILPTELPDRVLSPTPPPIPAKPSLIPLPSSPSSKINLAHLSRSPVTKISVPDSAARAFTEIRESPGGGAVGNMQSRRGKRVNDILIPLKSDSAAAALRDMVKGKGGEASTKVSGTVDMNKPLPEPPGGKGTSIAKGNGDGGEGGEEGELKKAGRWSMRIVKSEEEEKNADGKESETKNATNETNKLAPEDLMTQF